MHGTYCVSSVKLCIQTSTTVLASVNSEEQVLRAVDVAVNMNLGGEFAVNVPDYVDENVSVKVVKIIQSYTGIVNKVVWKKI